MTRREAEEEIKRRYPIGCRVEDNEGDQGVVYDYDFTNEDHFAFYNFDDDPNRESCFGIIYCEDGCYLYHFEVGWGWARIVGAEPSDSPLQSIFGQFFP